MALSTPGAAEFWLKGGLITHPRVFVGTDLCERAVGDLESPLDDGIVVLGRRKPCTALKHLLMPLDRGCDEPFVGGSELSATF